MNFDTDLYARIAHDHVLALLEEARVRQQLRRATASTSAGVGGVQRVWAQVITALRFRPVSTWESEKAALHGVQEPSALPAPARN